MTEAITTVVFDLGGVLIDWDPRHLYRKIFDDEARMERFLATVCNRAWIEAQDAGLPASQAAAELIARHPDWRREIEAYHARWPETMAREIAGTVEILDELAARGTPLYVISNFSADTFPHAEQRFSFLTRFHGLVISGREGIKKPDSRIFELLIARHGIAPETAIFIDDVPGNVTAARASGLQGHHFTSPEALRARLSADRLVEPKAS